MGLVQHDIHSLSPQIPILILQFHWALIYTHTVVFPRFCHYQFLTWASMKESQIPTSKTHPPPTLHNIKTQNCTLAKNQQHNTNLHVPNLKPYTSATCTSNPNHHHYHFTTTKSYPSPAMDFNLHNTLEFLEPASWITTLLPRRRLNQGSRNCIHKLRGESDSLRDWHRCRGCEFHSFDS